MGVPKVNLKLDLQDLAKVEISILQPEVANLAFGNAIQEEGGEYSPVLITNVPIAIALALLSAKTGTNMNGIIVTIAIGKATKFPGDDFYTTRFNGDLTVEL